MCTRCKGFAARIRIGTPREYLDLVRQLDDLVATGVFRLVDGIPLKEILEAKLWPSDLITHILECTACKQRFRLDVDTYHGSGGTWEMMPEAEETTKTEHPVQ